MAVVYLDPEFGNDANDGTTFANRKKTIPANPASGDEYRVIASRAPVSVGNATWTDGSQTVILPSDWTLEIDDCESAWTGATNVTAAFASNPGTTRNIWSQGTGVCRFTVLAAFTTGKIGYKTLGSTLDLSGFTAIAMKMASSTAFLSGELTLNLCSDTTGDTPLLSLPLPAIGTTGTHVLLDNVTALPSGINSLSLSSSVDPGSNRIIDFDNIIAVQSPYAATHISHDCLIGKMTAGEPEFYPIKGIDGTTIILGNMWMTPPAGSLGRTYKGTSETVETFILQPINAGAQLGPTTVSSNPLTITGGWDRTAMSSQSGETWLSGSGNRDTVLTVHSRAATVDKVSACHCITAAYTMYSSPYLFQSFSAQGMVNCWRPYSNTSLGARALKLDLDWACGVMFLEDNTDANRAANYTRVRVGRWLYNVTYGLFDSGYTQAAVKEMQDIVIGTIKNCQNGIGPLGRGAAMWLRGAALEDCDNDIVTGGGRYYLDGVTFDISKVVGPASNDYTAEIRATGIAGGDPMLMFGQTPHWSYRTQTSVVVTGGHAWQGTLTLGNSLSPINVDFPAKIPLLNLLLTAGDIVTIAAKCRRDHTSVALGLWAEPLASGDVVADWQTPTVDTWVDTEISFTADRDGVHEVFGAFYGSTAAKNAYFDEIVVTKT